MLQFGCVVWVWMEMLCCILIPIKVFQSEVVNIFLGPVIKIHESNLIEYSLVYVQYVASYSQ